MRRSVAATPVLARIEICFPIRFRKASARTRSAIQGPGTATGISSSCQCPIGGNIIIGARTASSPRESLHPESCTRSTKAHQELCDRSSFETATLRPPQDEGTIHPIALGASPPPWAVVVAAREGFFPLSLATPPGRASSGSGWPLGRSGLGEPGQIVAVAGFTVAAGVLNQKVAIDKTSIICDFLRARDL